MVCDGGGIMHYSQALNDSVSLQRLCSPEARQVFMGIYNNLLLLPGVARLRSLLVCASSPGEGATTTALGLAMTVAEVQSQPVLLLDGNFANPQVCRALQEPELQGFGDLIAGTAEVRNTIRTTEIPHLLIMGAGAVPLNHASRLEPPYFRELLAKLSEEFRLIIIDGPPVNMFPESVLYAGQVDSVFLVVHAGVTRVQVVSAALARLTAAGCDQVDIVLNRRTFPIPPWIYKRL
jgi:protein-tyrosine kinase